MKLKINTVFLYILCSVVFLLFPLFSSPDFPDVGRTLSNPNGIREVFTHILLLFFFYFSYFLLVPRLYFRQRYLLFYLAVLLCAVFIFFILFGLLGSLTLPQQGFHGQPGKLPAGVHGPKGPPRFNLLRRIFFDYSLYLMLIMLFASLLLRTNERWRQLRQEKLETELSYLKAQINPHFLFNTLNSIYALAIEKSDYTATAVVKLSGMMRYLISESGRHFVSLEKELNYISDYLELQQFRLGATVKTRYRLEGSYTGRQIAPLILITFVENAFKYGVNPEEHSEIAVAIQIEEERLTLKVENHKVTLVKTASDTPGLGISNTRHRLEMLYPGRHRLEIREDAEKFRVHLELNLL